MKYNNLEDVAKDYPNKAEREIILSKMNKNELDVLIKNMSNVYGKIYLSKFKKASK